MYIGFNLRTAEENQKYQSIGEEVGISQKAEIDKVLRNFANENSTLKGNEIQKSWFPGIKADVFISHGRSDKGKALGLAGMLKEEFNLISFVDSNVWGYADELLRIIDNNYCKTSGGEYYDYSLRNLSTSHVHMMLTSALAMIIDSTECLFFINQDGILPKETIDKTKSPWIYYEIGISSLLPKKEPSRFLSESVKAFGDTRQHLEIEYKLDSKHLVDLSDNDLGMWKQRHKNQLLHQKEHALDILYQLMKNKIL